MYKLELKKKDQAFIFIESDNLDEVEAVFDDVLDELTDDETCVTKDYLLAQGKGWTLEIKEVQ